jgi:molybdopterin/thiamine biosynthesis adenylyltransferase
VGHGRKIRYRTLVSPYFVLERGFFVAREEMTPSITQRATPALARARVLVIGMGGLGTPAARILARAGVGTLALVDPDRVEPSNLHRQLLYDRADAGRLKVDVAAERLRGLAPGVRVEIRADRFGPEDSHRLAAFDLVLDGTDTVAAKFLLSDAAVATGTALVHAGVVGWRAQLLTVLPGRSPCYRCLFEDAPPAGEVPSCEEAGVLGPVATLAGALQGAEALRVLAGTPAYAGRLLTIDAGTGRWRTVAFDPNPECPACARWHAEPARSHAS